MSEQGLSQPCASDGDCVTGLSCLEVFASDGGSAPMKVTSCTVDCTTEPCPEGSVCVWTQTTSMDIDGNVLDGQQVCAVPCATNEECQVSTRAGRCIEATWDDVKICHPLGCWPPQSECLAGYECVDVEIGDPSSPGWCQQL